MNRTWTPIPCSCNNPGCTRWDIQPEGGTPVGPFTKDEAVLLAASGDLLAALLDVQTALARFRDDEPYTHPEHGDLTLEEVKTMIVDYAIAEATPHIDWDAPASDRENNAKVEALRAAIARAKEGV